MKLKQTLKEHAVSLGITALGLVAIAVGALPEHTHQIIQAAACVLGAFPIAGIAGGLYILATPRRGR